jgi:hypothetical protein
MTGSLRPHFFFPALLVLVNANMPDLYQLSLKYCSSNTLAITCPILLPLPVSNLAIMFALHSWLSVLNIAILSTTLSISLSYALTLTTASPLTGVALLSKSADPTLFSPTFPLPPCT